MTEEQILQTSPRRKNFYKGAIPDPKEVPCFITVDNETLEKFGVPYRVSTIWKHRTAGGPLKKYTVKKGNRLFFALRKFLEDLQKEVEKQAE